MSRYIWDTETDGFLAVLTKIHSLCLRHIDTGERLSFADHPGYRPIREGLTILALAELIVGHNIIKFDIPAAHKVYPEWKPLGVVRDTIVLSRLVWPHAADKDAVLVKRGKMPRNLTGKHSLEAWGHRLGNHKGSFDGPWDAWTPVMQTYCGQDVDVTFDLWHRIAKENWSEESIELEHQVAKIVFRQETRGIGFNEKAAHDLHSTLVQRRWELEKELQTVFKPWFSPGRVVTPVRDVNFKDVMRASTWAGAAYTKVTYTTFNPGSRHHIAGRLQTLRGWEPTEFTPDGSVKVDEEILGALPWPEAKVITEYLTVEKRIGQISEGKEAWLRHVRNGRIFGGVIPCGAHTGRMTHMKPNLSQVPANTAPYGKECRSLFIPTEGYVLVGIDAEAIELRNLAGYMAAYDGGAYIKTVLEGRKEDGTDIHSVNARALGLDPKKVYQIWGQSPTGRDIAKVWFYAFIYGAGNKKLGLILGVKGTDAKIASAGKRSRETFLVNLPALGKLVDGVKKTMELRGHLRGLDRRRLSPRSMHAALNTLLQSAGAVFMKKALVLLDTELQSQGMIPGTTYEFVLNVHDEWQIEVLPELAERVGQIAARSITLAGEAYEFRCPLAGSYHVGNSWADTH